MSKAILVIDMPKNCGNCPILEYCHNNDGKCDLNIRQDWCPLREVPKRDNNEGLYQLEYTQGYMSGWNACLEEILGE